MPAIEPFHLAVPQAELDDLQRRLAFARLPEPATTPGWDQGVPVAQLAALIDHWRTTYDWRRCEAMLNRLGQFRTEIDGLGIHFLHIRSPHAGALPLIMTHGWPGSVIEFHKVIAPLVDPTAHGGSADDAFHLVLPTLPGFGFSDKPAESGWGIGRIARAWAELMARLGYTDYVAQGGDWGSAVTVQMGAQRLTGLIGIHLNMLSLLPGDLSSPMGPDEQAALATYQYYDQVESAYARQQATRPQTLGYALADSPVGQAAWIYEKLSNWSDCDGEPGTVFTHDEILDNIMHYWLPNAGASSGRLYRESLAQFVATRVELPVGASLFPKEIIAAPRSWADRVFPQIVHWNTLPRGGHFAAFEQPATFIDELRTCFRKMR
jgi:pimeloyl-ACP methyl ester carboxylesterase